MEKEYWEILRKGVEQHLGRTISAVETEPLELEILEGVTIVRYKDTAIGKITPIIEDSKFKWLWEKII